MALKFAFTTARSESTTLPFSYVESTLFGYLYRLSYNVYDRDGESEL